MNTNNSTQSNEDVPGLKEAAKAMVNEIITQAMRNRVTTQEQLEFKWLPKNPTAEMISSVNDYLIRDQFIEGYKQLWEAASSDLPTIFQVIRTGYEDYDLVGTFSTREKAEYFMQLCLDYEESPTPDYDLEIDEETNEVIKNNWEDYCTAMDIYDKNHPAGWYNGCATDYSIIEVQVQ
jgi:hypothetical protein